MKKGLKILFVIIFICLLGVFAYLLLTDKTKTEATDDKKVPEEIIEEVPKLTIVNEDSTSRPYAVMINNLNAARPVQSGLQDAYIIYEMIVEGGITRMMALFKDADLSRIGAVRSARPYYLDYALENDAIYVHYGWSANAESDIQTLKVNNINGLYDLAFFRDNPLNIAYEHTAFTSTKLIEDIVTSKNYRIETNSELLLNYTTDVVDLSSLEGAIVANNVVIPYSDYMTSSYTYDSINKVYLRFANGVAHSDYVTGEQYSFKNIITYKIENYSIDSYGRQALNNIGNGEGYYITNGYAVPITWQKDSRTSQTIYKLLNGTEIDINDGNTFIQIQPSIQELTIN